MAHACAAYLRFSLDLIDENHAESDVVLQVAKGFHNLHRYAFGHWGTHFEHAVNARDDHCSDNLRATCEAVSKRYAALLEAKNLPLLSDEGRIRSKLKLEVTSDLQVFDILMHDSRSTNDADESSQFRSR